MFEGMYVVSTKSVVFNIDIINNDSTHVITGVRVLLGNQDIQRVPAYIEVLVIVIYCIKIINNYHIINIFLKCANKCPNHFSVIF